MIHFGSWYLNLASGVAILLLFIYWKFVSVLNYWKERGVYFLKPTPFFGNIKDLVLVRKSEGEVYQDIYQQLGDHPYGGIYQINKPTLFIKDLELIKSVLVKNFRHFHDRGLPPDEGNNPLNSHLFLLQGQKWRNLRVKLTPTFTSGKMKAMFDILDRCSQEMVANLEKTAAMKETIEMKQVFAERNTDIIGSYAFGLQLNTIKNSDSQFRHFSRKIFEPSIRLRLRGLVITFLPWITKLGVLRKFLDPALEKFFIKVVTDTVKYREQNNIKRNDFLQLLIELKNKGNVGDAGYTNDDAHLRRSISNMMPQETSEENDVVMTDNIMASQCFLFFLAGFETSSSTASFCVHELAVNPDIQERVRKEVDSVLKEYNGKITYEGIQKMKYLGKVVDARVYFSSSYLTKVGLAALLSKYKFSVSHKTTFPVVLDPKGFTLSAKDGLWLQISERT